MMGKLVQKNPADRYQSARELLTDLEVLITPTARHSLAPHSRSFIGKTVHRPKLARILIVAAAVVFVATAIYFWRTSTASDNTRTTAAVSPPPPIHSVSV